ncbi:MAG: hypothetical protein NNA21_01205 [Nitrospira sp.]|nr:hypothetical protein [Nitrospira sp.]MCP9461969.1 hypothetical protein [Nitrospira sp.]
MKLGPSTTSGGVVKDTPLLKLLVQRWIITKRQEIEILRRDIEPSPK